MVNPVVTNQRLMVTNMHLVVAIIAVLTVMAISAAMDITIG